jgi:hypothetical protein
VGYSLGAVLPTKYTADADSGYFGHFGHRTFSQATLDPPLHTLAHPDHCDPSTLSTHSAFLPSKHAEHATGHAVGLSPLATPPRSASGHAPTSSCSGQGSCTVNTDPEGPKCMSVQPLLGLGCDLHIVD